MPTKRRRSTRNWRDDSVPPTIWAYLQTGDDHADDETFFVVLGHSDAELEKSWQRARDTLLPEWIAERRGTRPWGWWRFDAPRWQRADLPERCRALGDVFLVKLAEPRRRLGGIGTPIYEVLNYVPSFDRGLPDRFVDPSDCDFYNGRATDIHGNRVGTEYHEGHFTGLAPDRSDPPRFENETAYLARHGLLTPAERNMLPGSAYEPETITIPAPLLTASAWPPAW